MSDLKGNCIIAQSGGPTAVINASVYGVIEEATKHNQIQGIYGAINGILGVLNTEIIDLRKESPGTINGLKSTPASALGSCRYKLKPDDYEKVMEVFKKYNIRYFFYAGGNDSMDTANRVNNLACEQGYELKVIGVPKTVDNDLRETDHCPGYGSVIRHNAIAIRDAGMDTEAIGTTDKVKIFETMGRDTGWIAAGSALAREEKNDAPHLIYLPEKPMSIDKFLTDVQNVYDKLGYVFIAASEGVVGEDKQPLAALASKVDLDSFGHRQYGDVGAFLAELVRDKLKLKARWEKPGTMQRSAADRASKVDIEEACLVGRFAVKSAVEGKSGFMVTLIREKDSIYKIHTGLVGLEKVANLRKAVPSNFINEKGNDVTEDFLEYARPLIGGPFHPYVRLKKVKI
jgi:6-phosphofructokinase